jgi:hypothetical protein
MFLATKGHKEKRKIKTIIIKNFWKSRNLFSKRFLEAKDVVIDARQILAPRRRVFISIYFSTIF